ncbi:outer membrane beta-barrel protein [Flavobacterium sp. WC2509]|uniref:outer membrane beta-barrel protein n=1 Tax=Flavobacterium sp. WC2509 TaxID=3461406 RepID=UPI004043AF3B
MRKTTLLLVFALSFSFVSVFAQARKELNFGLVGINYEIPVHRDITIAPGVGTNFDLDWLNVGVKANYYFDNLFGISNAAWDVYGGANVGYAFDMRDDHDNNGHDESDVDFGLQAGARWFWNDKWGVYAEIAGGSVSGLSPAIGLTVKL